MVGPLSSGAWARDMILGEFPEHSGLGAHLDPAGVDSARGSLTGECWDPNISAPLFRAGWASGRFSVSLVLPALAEVALTVLELLSSRHGPTRMEQAVLARRLGCAFVSGPSVS